MYKNIICITNRNLCPNGLENQISKIVSGDVKPRAVILREKDLDADSYIALAEKIMPLCRENGVRCVLHTFASAALSLGADALHLPLCAMRSLTQNEKDSLGVIGVSCHSVSEAREAEALGAGYITAGHVFYTECKKGAPPRGVGFLNDVCRAVSIPVFALGGITSENYALALRSGAFGVALMSSLMASESPSEYMSLFNLPGRPRDENIFDGFNRKV